MPQRRNLIPACPFCCFCLLNPPACGYTDNMLPNAMPKDWKQTLYRVICNVNVEGQEVYTHYYQSYPFFGKPKYPIWRVSMLGRAGKHLLIFVESRRSPVDSYVSHTYTRHKSGGWSETAPDPTNFSGAETNALRECMDEGFSKKYQDFKQTK